jgi:hypothetical protein
MFQPSLTRPRRSALTASLALAVTAVAGACSDPTGPACGRRLPAQPTAGADCGAAAATATTATVATNTARSAPKSASTDATYKPRTF